MSVVLQALLLPANLPRLPDQWSWFLALHRSLCDYLLPGFPSRLLPGGPIAALDVFCTASDTSIGGHYDTGDVFYFVLDGEKEWIVELIPDIDTGLRLAAEGTNYKLDRLPQSEHTTICVRPGDCLYVPPYTYHRVSSHGRSLAVSVGLPTFNELTLIRNSLVRIQREHALFDPLPSFPRTHRSLSCDAETETQRRTLSALGLPRVEDTLF
jgi:ribosomal protein L16 Arg81 hydroxylase